MNIVEIKQFGEVEAIKLGYGPIGRPFMSVYLYILDGLVIDTGQRHMQKTLLEMLNGKKLHRILLTLEAHYHGDTALCAFGPGRRFLLGYRAAIEHCARALELAPDYADAHACLSWAYWALWNDFGTDLETRRNAERSGQRALAIDIRNGLARNILTLLSMSSGDWEDAEARVEESLRFAPRNSGVRLVHGWLLLETGRVPEALDQARAAIEIDPLWTSAHALAGVAALAAGRTRTAISHSERSLELNPDNYEVWFKLSRVLQRLGDSQGARRAGRKHAEVRERIRPTEPRSSRRPGE